MIHSLFSIAIKVFEGVNSAQCPDCNGEIKRIDATGKCISCFPCPECNDGYTISSVLCGATVPYETDIECVVIPIAPPASSKTRSLPFKFTATPVTSIIPTSSSSVSSAPSVVKDERPPSTKKPEVNKAVPSIVYHSKWGTNTSIILITVIVLLLVFGAIVFRCKQIRKKHSMQLRVGDNRQVTTPSVQRLAAQEDGTHNIDIATNNVMFFRTSDFLNGPGAQSPSSAAVHLTEENTMVLTRLEKKSTSTSTTGLFDQTATFPKFSDIPQEFQNSFLSKKVAAIRNQFYCKICQKLDALRNINRDDYRLLGEKVGVDRDAILCLEQKGNQTEEILRHFDSKRGNCVGRFKIILEEMGRNDVVTVIEDWILSEWQENIQFSRVM